MTRQSTWCAFWCAFRALPIALAIGGCSTFLDGEPNTGKNEGQVYYLPQPVIVVTPKPDGTATVEVKYLPDPTKSYVVRTRSLLSSYTLDVKTKDGLLETVSLDADATAVAKAGIDAGATIADKALQAKQKRAEDAAKAQQERATKEQELEQAVILAQVRVRTLKTLQQDAKNDIKESQIVEANLALTEAMAKLAAFRGKSTETIGASINPSGSFDAPSFDDTTGTTEQAPGPMIFSIVVAPDGTPKLESEPQRLFDTITVEKPTPPAATPHMLNEGRIPVVRAGDIPAETVVTFSAKVGLVAGLEGGVLKGPYQNANDPGIPQVPLISSGLAFKISDTTIIITVPPRTVMPDGLYTIVLPLTGADGTVLGAKDVLLNIMTRAS